MFGSGHQVLHCEQSIQRAMPLPEPTLHWVPELVLLHICVHACRQHTVLQLAENATDTDASIAVMHMQ